MTKRASTSQQQPPCNSQDPSRAPKAPGSRAIRTLIGVNAESAGPNDTCREHAPTTSHMHIRVQKRPNGKRRCALLRCPRPQEPRRLIRHDRRLLALIRQQPHLARLERFLADRSAPLQANPKLALLRCRPEPP